MKNRPVKKAGATKKTPAKKGGSTKTAGKRPSRQKKESRPYVMPKTAAEHGIVCRSPAPGADGECGAAVIWFDYALGEKNHMQGFVCNEHRVSDRVEKLALPKPASLE